MLVMFNTSNIMTNEMNFLIERVTNVLLAWKGDNTNTKVIYISICKTPEN